MTTTCPLCESPAEAHPTEVRATDIFCPSCGGARITVEAQAEIGQLTVEGRRRLAWAAADAGRSGRRVFLGTPDVDHVLSIMPPRIDPFEPMDLILDFLGRTAGSADQWLSVPDMAFPQFHAMSREELGHYKNLISDASLAWVERKRGTPPEDQLRLKPEGWRRLGEMRRTARKSNQGFVAMWFDPSMTEAWEVGFYPAIYSCGYDPSRIDKENFEGRVDDEILKNIRQSALVIADFTGNRAGVYFEAGFAMALGIPVVWTCREDHFASVHFDTNHYPFIVWHDIQALVSQLSNRVDALYPRTRRDLPVA